MWRTKQLNLLKMSESVLLNPVRVGADPGQDMLNANGSCIAGISALVIRLFPWFKDLGASDSRNTAVAAGSAGYSAKRLRIATNIAKDPVRKT